MMKQVSVAVAFCVSLTVLLTGGCGSGSGPGAIDQVLEPRIHEYVGDGGGSLKPWPSLFPAPAADSASTLPAKMLFGSLRTDKVPRRLVSWYRVAKNPFQTTTTLVVTLQPTADEDSDLFVFEGKGKDYRDGTALLAGSWRKPTDPGAIGGAGGYAPDWVGIDIPFQGSFPMAYIAVYGCNETPKTKHYRIETVAADLRPLDELLSFGAERYTSNWVYFNATSGTQYTVDMDQGIGDVDVFVYGSDSSKFIDSNTSTGDAEIVFTPSTTGRHYVRLYGYSPGTSGASLTITSP